MRRARLALALTSHDDTDVAVFLMGDAVTVACRGTCLDARGLTKERLIDETSRSSIEELAAWTVEADQVLVF